MDCPALVLLGSNWLASMLDLTGLDWTGFAWKLLDLLGLDVDLLSCWGRHWIRQNWIGLSWTGLNGIGLNFGQDLTELDWTELNWISEFKPDFWLQMGW